MIYTLDLLRVRECSQLKTNSVNHICDITIYISSKGLLKYKDK